MHQRIKKYFLLTSGLFFVALAIMGAILPILPTTPFLILALACFTNSSPRYHQMLLNNRWFGGTLQQWQENHTINRTAKIKAMIIIVLTFSISIGILHGKLSLQLMLLTLASLLLFFLWRLKEPAVKGVDK
jgi:hypothetical protein